MSKPRYWPVPENQKYVKPPPSAVCDMCIFPPSDYLCHFQKPINRYRSSDKILSRGKRTKNFQVEVFPNKSLEGNQIHQN